MIHPFSIFGTGLGFANLLVLIISSPEKEQRRMNLQKFCFFRNQKSAMTEKQFELSRYELNRKPQELIQDDTEIKVQRKALNALLMCPICLDVLRSTMTTKECLHRFCAECITTALRSGNKECPTCRKVSFFRFL